MSDRLVPWRYDIGPFVFWLFVFFATIEVFASYDWEWVMFAAFPVLAVVCLVDNIRIQRSASGSPSP